MEEVRDGAIAVLTLEVEGMIACQFEINESGDLASLKRCKVYTDDENLVKEALTSVMATLHENGIANIKVDEVIGAESITLSLEWVMS